MAASAGTYGAAIRKAIQDPAKIATLVEIEQEIATLREVALRGLRQIRAGDAAAGRQMIIADFGPKIPLLRAKNRQFTERLEKLALERSNVLTQEAEAAVRLSVVVLALGLTLSFGGGIWLTLATVVRPFGRLHRSMQGLAGGDLATPVGDTARTTRSAPWRGPDHFGESTRGAALQAEQERSAAEAEVSRRPKWPSLPIPWTTRQGHRRWGRRRGPR